MHEFKEYPTERLMIDSLWSRMTPVEREYRLALLDSIIDNGGPVTPASVDWQAAHHGGAESDALFQALAEKNVIVVADGAVQYAYPVSAHPTSHAVHLADGRSFSAMCAIDAMGSALTLGQDTVIEDSCGVCGQPITVRVTRGALESVVPGGAYAIHADLSGSENWAASC